MLSDGHGVGPLGVNDLQQLQSWLGKVSDAEIHNVLTNLGGHCFETLIEAFGGTGSNRTVFICYTIKVITLNLALILPLTLTLTIALTLTLSLSLSLSLSLTLALAQSLTLTLTHLFPFTRTLY